MRAATWRSAICAVVGVGLALWLGAVVGVGRAAAAPPRRDPVPVLAYYYIWFDPSSWDLAKSDYPLLGRYSSDDRDVMRQHVRWAKEAGIAGFVVSWKNTSTLSRRLERLVDVARAEGFKLAIIYQGLDFERRPLPAGQVAADLDYFAERYAASEVFDLFGKPVVVWSGTWEFSREEIASVATPARRQRLLLLASERSSEDYRRLADLVDGDAYYWSSVDPERDRGHLERLRALEQVVHARGGLWIAPAAPGFDARLLGGERNVERQDGQTLRRELDVALQSSPDAIGLISWNEFSENSHVEPSERYGRRYLEVLADVRGARLPAVNADSSEPGAATALGYGLPLVGALVGVTGLALLVVARRAWRERGSDTEQNRR